MAQTSPLQEWKQLGFYHERLIAVTKNEVCSTEFLNEVRTNESPLGKESEYFTNIRKQTTTRYRFVGRATNFDPDDFLAANPRNFASQKEVVEWKQAAQKALKENKDAPAFPGDKYNKYTNNCQDHTQAVLGLLGMR